MFCFHIKKSVFRILVDATLSPINLINEYSCFTFT